MDPPLSANKSNKRIQKFARHTAPVKTALKEIAMGQPFTISKSIPYGRVNKMCRFSREGSAREEFRAGDFLSRDFKAKIAER